MNAGKVNPSSPRIFNVEYSFDGERWSTHGAGDDPRFEFSENERWHGEQVVNRVMRATYGPNVRWRWAEKASS